ncbi:prephenate dehydrogenase [Bianquea renquensis]|uniref:Prephenate dehydrogenase n=1 Tax=Bianquea renquensis TaxID=2763661 RepID=A0A926I0C2_9FIRM|nr:prephenate dehydrogenase [Bianquea renquensis]MBC8542060.1 prephenate dehydrogenase [Bianquea renquensis]
MKDRQALPALLQGRTVIVGLGLMGASLAKGIKDLSAAAFVAGLDRKEQPIFRGLEEKVLDQGAVLSTQEDSVRSLIQEATLIILSMYPDGILDFVSRYRETFSEGTVLMDICGLKGFFLEEAQRILPEGVEFVGTHPMAGKEKSGYEYGNGEIFLGANFVITPTLHNRRETLDQVRAMARELGFGRIREVEPREHDEVIAYTSHMPHALAAALVNSWLGTEDVISFAGGSFRDVTRVADINSALWAQLFCYNSQALSGELRRFSEILDELAQMVEQKDRPQIEAFLTQAAERKERWNREGDRYDDGSRTR